MKWFYAWLHAKERIEELKERPAWPEDHDSKVLFCFTERSFRQVNTRGCRGKFDRACQAIEIELDTLQNTIKPNLRGTDEWFPYLLGLEAGLLIARHQLRLLRDEKKGH